MKKIALTQGKFTIVDDNNYDELMQWKWYAHKEGRDLFYARRDIYISKTKKYKPIFIHRYLLGDVKGRVIDHINRNSLDNRLVNLRHVTIAQNGWNKRKKGIGVRYRPKRKKWEAAIWHIGQHIYIGLFDTEYAAKFAVNITKRYFRKEFA